MPIEFDSAKDKVNIAKHGVSLALADELDWDAALVWIDARFEYEELRMIALAPRTSTLYYVAFVERGDIRRYHQLAPCRPPRGEALCRQPLSGRKISVPTLEEDATIRAAALSDPDAQPLTDDQLAAMVPLRAVRGRPKSESTKQLVSVRYSPEVLAFFRSTGEGWQARMDGVLRDYVARHSPRPLKPR